MIFKTPSNAVIPLYSAGISYYTLRSIRSLNRCFPRPYYISLCNGKSSKRIHDHHNELLQHRHAQLNPRIPIRQTKAIEGRIRRKNTVQQADGNRRQRGRDGTVDSFFSAGRLAHVGGRDDGQGEEEGVDDEEDGEADFGGFLAGCAGGGGAADDAED